MGLKKGFILLVSLLLAVGTVFVPVAAAAAKSSKNAVVLQVEGDAHITKKGGTKQFRLFKGMTLNQGDYLVTGPGAKVILEVEGREDEVTIGENASLYISELTETDDGGKSKFKLWAGSVWNKVKTLAGAQDEFEVETPTAVMGVRGTQFMVVFDPVSGRLMVTTAAGIVAAQPSGLEGAEAIILPLRVFELFKGEETADPNENVTVLDLDAFFKAANADLIEKMILETPQLHEEIARLQEEWEQNPDIGQPPTLEDVTNVFIFILQESVKRGVLTESKATELAETVNRNIADSSIQIDLGKSVPSTAEISGVDPEEEAGKLEKRKQVREQYEQQARELMDEKEELKNENPDVYNTVQENRQQQQQEAEQFEQERSQSAYEEYASGLTEEQRQLLEQERAAREAEIEQQRQAAESKQSPAQETPAGTDSGTGGGTSGGGTPGGGTPGGGQPGGQDPGDAEDAVVRIDENSLDFAGQLVWFTLIVEASKDATGADAVFGAELHVAVPASSMAPDWQNQDENPWSLFGGNQASGAVWNWKLFDDASIDGEHAIEMIVSFMMFPDADGIPVTKGSQLISLPVQFHPAAINPASVPVHVDLLLVNKEGEKVLELNSKVLTIQLPQAAAD